MKRNQLRGSRWQRQKSRERSYDETGDRRELPLSPSGEVDQRDHGPRVGSERSTLRVERSCDVDEGSESAVGLGPGSEVTEEPAEQE